MTASRFFRFQPKRTTAMTRKALFKSLSLLALSLPASAGLLALSAAPAHAQSSPISAELSVSLNVVENLSVTVDQDVVFCSLVAGTYPEGRMYVNDGASCFAEGLTLLNDGILPQIGQFTINGPANGIVETQFSIAQDFGDPALTLDLGLLTFGMISELDNSGTAVVPFSPELYVNGTIAAGQYTAIVELVSALQ